MDAESMAAGGGIVGGIAAIVGGVVKLVGSRKERDASTQTAADEWQELHGECRREVAELRGIVDGMRVLLLSLEDRVRQEHAPCRAVEAAQQRQIDELNHEVSVLRRAVDGLLSNTPRQGLYVPDDVRAAMAQEDSEHG